MCSNYSGSKFIIMKKVSAIKSIATCKCPRCRKGKVFTYKNPYHRKFGKIEDKCSHCKLVYEMEQGFWYGAMYISYALGVLLMLFIWLIHFIFFPFVDIKHLIIFIMLSIILFCPYNFFYSRLIWINFFISFSDTKSNLKN